jgi:hypothetical protein
MGGHILEDASGYPDPYSLPAGCPLWFRHDILTAVGGRVKILHAIGLKIGDDFAKSHDDRLIKLRWSLEMRGFSIIVGGLLLAAALPGCGDPEESRLAVGSKAMVIGHKVEGTRQGGDTADIEGMIYPWVDDGTLVKVVGDDDDQEHGWKTRKVRVRILDGPLKERTGTITRWSLRPE